jgi:hypothetical protein
MQNSETDAHSESQFPLPLVTKSPLHICRPHTNVDFSPLNSSSKISIWSTQPIICEETQLVSSSAPCWFIVPNRDLHTLVNWHYFLPAHYSTQILYFIPTAIQFKLCRHHRCFRNLGIPIQAIFELLMHLKSYVTPSMVIPWWKHR